jgi:hypothetical protein
MRSNLVHLNTRQWPRTKWNRLHYKDNQSSSRRKHSQLSECRVGLPQTMNNVQHSTDRVEPTGWPTVWRTGPEFASRDRGHTRRIIVIMTDSNYKRVFQTVLRHADSFNKKECNIRFRQKCFYAHVQDSASTTHEHENRQAHNVRVSQKVCSVMFKHLTVCRTCLLICGTSTAHSVALNHTKYAKRVKLKINRQRAQSNKTAKILFFCYIL